MSRPIRSQFETIGFGMLPQVGADRRRPWVARVADRAVWLAIGVVVARVVLG